MKDLSDYRKHGEMPRLIVVIDEFQVLFSDSATKEKERVEAYLTTILKKGRSYGVHLILATQTMRGADINKALWLKSPTASLCLWMQKTARVF